MSVQRLGAKVILYQVKRRRPECIRLEGRDQSVSSER